MIVVTACGDLQDRVALGEHAPDRALGAAQPPAGLVHVDRPGRTDLVEQVLARLGQRVGGAGEDRVDRPGTDPRANSCSQSSTTSRRLMRLRTESVTTAACNRGPNALSATSAGSWPARPAPQPGQRTTLALVLGHPDRHHRQLLDLTTRRLAHRDAIGLAEHVPAATAGRPVLDDLVDRPRRQQRPALALMPG